MSTASYLAFVTMAAIVVTAPGADFAVVRPSEIVYEPVSDQIPSVHEQSTPAPGRAGRFQVVPSRVCGARWDVAANVVGV